MHETIAAGDVKPGDRIYNKGAYHHKWVMVIKVEHGTTTWTTEDHTAVKGECIIITTTDWSTTKHPREGIAIRRGP